MKNRYHYAKVVKNARINFSNSPYCTLLFSRKENFKFFEVALPAVPCNGAVGCIMNVWGYPHWNAAAADMELKVFFSLRSWLLCMTSLPVASSMLKTFVKFLGTSKNSGYATGLNYRLPELAVIKESVAKNQNARILVFNFESQN